MSQTQIDKINDKEYALYRNGVRIADVAFDTLADAPDMLEALKRLADAVDSGNVSEQSLGALEAYRVIAKVTGGAE